MTMQAAVVVFPGSNREGDAARALEAAMGHSPIMVWHRDSDLPKVDLIVVPGGVSYGDYLRCGAIAGVFNDAKNVLGLMPHPENAVESLHGSTDGKAFFKGIVEALS